MFANSNPFQGSKASASGSFGGGMPGFGGNLGGFLGGLFGDSGAPYDKAMDKYKDFFNQGKNTQMPFYNAGVGAIGNYQDWLKGMQDPSGFINGLMGKYQESPFAKNLQQQSMRAGTNAASMGGLPNGMGGAGAGSTPFAQQLQQNANNISSGDQNQWLQNVLGVNTQYGQGQGNLIGVGQNSANQMTDLMKFFGDLMGQGAYGREAGQQQDKWNMIGGGLGLLGNIFGFPT